MPRGSWAWHGCFAQCFAHSSPLKVEPMLLEMAPCRQDPENQGLPKLPGSLLTKLAAPTCGQWCSTLATAAGVGTKRGSCRRCRSVLRNPLRISIVRVSAGTSCRKASTAADAIQHRPERRTDADVDTHNRTVPLRHRTRSKNHQLPDARGSVHVACSRKQKPWAASIPLRV